MAAAWAGAGWAAVIFGMSQLPGSAVPGRFGTLAHFVEYAVLAALLLASLAERDELAGPLVAAVSLASSWGATDELHQAFVTMRTPDPVDWLVDSAGALAGAFVLAMVLRALVAKSRA